MGLTGFAGFSWVTYRPHRIFLDSVGALTGTQRFQQLPLSSKKKGKPPPIRGTPLLPIGGLAVSRVPSPGKAGRAPPMIVVEGATVASR